MANQRMLWFQDGIKLAQPQEKWAKIDMLTHGLVETVGHPDFEHEVINPMEHLQALADQLPREATCVIDLTAGKLGSLFKDVFKSKNIIRDDFHLSRLRVVSSARFDGSGFLLNRPMNEFALLGQVMDLSRPVILDDVGWSGRSALVACQLMGINIPDTIFGFITCNRGEFGPKPGACGLIEQQGGSVVYGSFVTTPQDDGFHVSDFFNNGHMDRELFSLLIRIQQIREESALFPQITKQNERLVEQILRDGQTLLFPKALNSQEVSELEQVGLIVGMNGVPRGALFQPNPLNWLLPSFSKRVKSQDMINRSEDIIFCLESLSQLTKEGSVHGVEGQTQRREVSI